MASPQQSNVGDPQLRHPPGTLPQDSLGRPGQMPVSVLVV